MAGAYPTHSATPDSRYNPTYMPTSKLPQFDPLKVPVLAVDDHLPSVGLMALQPQALRERFSMPPAWQPEFREEPPYAERQTKHAAVLVPIVMRDVPMVLLTQRTAHLSTHSGQIAFPGGKVDETDADVSATALREAEEEVGLHRRYVEVIGNLPVYTTGSAFVITPVVALLTPGFVITPNANEVADVFEVPLAFLMNPANHRRHVVEAGGFKREWLSMPFEERFIWGATAGMLRNLYRFLSA